MTVVESLVVGFLVVSFIYNFLAHMRIKTYKDEVKSLERERDWAKEDAQEAKKTH